MTFADWCAEVRGLADQQWPEVSDQCPTLYAVWGGGATLRQALHKIRLILQPKAAWRRRQAMDHFERTLIAAWFAAAIWFVAMIALSIIARGWTSCRNGWEVPDMIKAEGSHNYAIGAGLAPVVLLW